MASRQGEVVAPLLPSGAEAERRQLSVMFADLVGSTALGARLDPEDLKQVVDAWRSCVTAIIVRHGGLVTRLMGDGVLALFGFPRAQETDAERAVRAGMAFIQAVRDLPTLAGPAGTLRTRVGIATGLVIAGDLIGSGPSLEWSVVGDTPNLAARLQTLAEPDMLVIDDLTHRLVGEMFEQTSLGAQQLKGFPSPVPVWALLRESRIENRFDALHGNRVPLVGRFEEIALLHRLWANVRSGNGQALFLLGEAGMGKSRIIAEFEALLGGSGGRVLHFACSPHHQDTPLYPVIRHFENATAFHRDDLPEAKLGKLRALLAESGNFAGEEIGALADLLSVPASSAAARPPTPQRAKELTFAVIQRYIEGFASKAPSLVVVEDLHWADPTTTELVETLIGAVGRIPAFLLSSRRPRPSLAYPEHPWVTLKTLGGLEHAHSQLLIRHVAGERGIADDIVARFVERAAGIPLFLEELTRSVLNRRAPAHGDGEAALGSPVAVETVPRTLNALLAARLDELGPGRVLAQASSVIGRECSHAMLQEVSGLPAPRLEQGVQELMQAGLLAPSGDEANRQYVFRHALVQEVAYASMLRDRRRAVHLRYAEALERDLAGPAANAPELLAAHFGQAGAPEKSIDYYLKAVQRATGRFALAEIVGYLHKALQKVGELPAGPAAQSKELLLRIELGRALIDHRGSGDEEVRRNMEHAQELCVALGETEKLLQVHDGLANYYIVHSDLAKVLDCAEQTLELGNRLGNRRAVALARRTSGYAQLLLGHFSEARQDLDDALAEYQPGMATTRDIRVSVCAALGICLTTIGLPDLGTATSHAAMRHAEALNHPPSVAIAFLRACVQAMMRRDVPRVQALSRQILDGQRAYETFRGVREAPFLAAWAELHTTAEPALHKELLDTLDRFEEQHAFLFVTFYMAATAELFMAQGDREHAAGLLRRAERLVQTRSERWCEAEISRLQARLTDDPVEAMRLLAASLAISREQGALWWELRAATDLARRLLASAREGEAARVLAPVLARMREGTALPDISSAHMLLRQLQARGQ